MLFFSVLLLLKGWFAWIVVFDRVPPWGVVLKELPFVLAVFCLIEWFAGRRKTLWYLLGNLFLTGIFFSVAVYYRYYGIIATYRSLDQVNQVTAVRNSVFSLLNPEYVLVFTDIVVIGALLLWRKGKLAWFQPAARRASRRAIAAVFAVSVGLCLMHILPNRASMNELVKAEGMGILNYEAYALFADPPAVAAMREAPEEAKLTQEAVDALKGWTEPAVRLYRGLAAGRNVIVVQLESLQNFPIGLEVNGEEVTPVLNRLAREHFYFPRFYQQVGQGSTSDAEFVANTSLYIPPDAAAADAYARKRLPGLPRLLSEAGYDTVTFHTNVVEFWNRGELYPALGFDRYYDKEFFGDEDKVFFGASDEVLYAKTAEELERIRRSGRPFYAQVISMTAHHPFTLPEEKHRITLPEQLRDTMVGHYILAQNYADYALGLFFAELKLRGLWDNSLIVVYGDHVGLPKTSLHDGERELLETMTGRPYDYRDMLNVPLIIAAPGATHPAVFKQVGGQVDLLPTIANLLGLSLEGQLHFGRDLLNGSGYNLLPQRHFVPSGSFLNDRVLFIPGSGFADGVHLPLAGDGSGEATEDEFNRALELQRLSHLYAQQLPDLEEGE
ncbi:MAG: sulfatase [Paenibacillaceae bacterium ZCTH02-B3]|nr:MAG: sulfatase [Paenibacillaceae bacterium ZCTH02-B3]